MKAGIFFAAALGVVVGLQAEVTWSGDVVVPAGEDVTCSDLTGITSLNIGAGATVRFTTAAPHAFPITGSGTIIKESADVWTMTTAIPNFQGNYEIAAGVVSISSAEMVGKNNSAYRVTVRDGATLAITTKEGMLSYRYVRFAGTGAPGRNGAVETPAISNTDKGLNNLELDGDATLYIPTDGLFFIYYNIKLNGHRLTFFGDGTPTIMGDCNVSTDGEIYVQSISGEPALTFRSWTHSNPTYQVASGAGPFVLSNRARISLSAGVKPIDRPLWLSGTNTLFHSANLKGTDEYSTNHANWAGAIMFTNQTGVGLLTVYNMMETTKWSAHCMLCVGGPISGNGMVKTYSYRGDSRVALLNAANTYTGGTYINNYADGASTLLGYPGTIPNEDFSSVTVRVGYADLALGDDYSRWTFDSAVRFLNNVYFESSGRVRFSSEFTTNGCGPVKFQLSPGTTVDRTRYLGARDEVMFEGTGNAEPIDFNWHGGKAHLTGPQPILLGQMRLKIPDLATASNSVVYIDNGADVTFNITNTICIGVSGGKQARLVVTNAVLKNSDVFKSDFYTDYPNPDWGGAMRGGAIFAGHYAPGILEVLDGAIISNRVIVSGNGVETGTPGSGSGGGQGAVYQRGGHVVALGATKGHHTSCVGMTQVGSAAGYYELSGGVLESRGQFVIGGYTYGCFAQYGGHVITSNRLDQADGTRTTTFTMATCNQGHGELYIKKGSWDVFAYDVGFGQGSTEKITIMVTLDGEEAELDLHDREIYTIYNNSNSRSYFNLNGGVMRSAGLRAYRKSYTSGGKTTYLTNIDVRVNFNGGTFKAGKNSCNLFGYNTTDPELYAHVDVYAGGATIDTDGKTGNRLDMPVHGAYGKGVKSITMPAPLSGNAWVGSPRVRIDGDGVGAAAFAHFDSTNMVVDRIIVTSPGSGYTTATAYVYSGKETVLYTLTSASGAVELADNETDGAFTKKGAGDLTLNATNTWGGATIVAGGTLKAGCDWAIPTNSAVRVSGGGVLNLNGKTARISSIEYGPGGGSVINGSAAELPATVSFALSLDDILAGNAITFTGSQDFTGATLAISGDDYSGFDKAVRRYAVLTVSDGSLTGAPTISPETAPPAPWCFVARNDGVVLTYVKGAIFTVR